MRVCGELGRGGEALSASSKGTGVICIGFRGELGLRYLVGRGVPRQKEPPPGFRGQDGSLEDVISVECRERQREREIIAAQAKATKRV